ncbi:hypothetical protein DPMN_030911 [Dreissena polymorpha]|uniref:Uncharacterized protein n=1 Tax=Dreissena polymorpha TaxID=45954 RepID=A0A9D4M1S3_DREPO|nr:hypothetical protein DPMN_030911 [Dreissena polymorpha]
MRPLPPTPHLGRRGTFINDRGRVALLSNSLCPLRAQKGALCLVLVVFGPVSFT